ncbi:hypothetical protein [Chitinophaga sp. YIM B06452]
MKKGFWRNGYMALLRDGYLYLWHQSANFAINPAAGAAFEA